MGLDYILTGDEPAKIKATRECFNKSRCIVLSRDYDPLMAINEMIQPVKVAERTWFVGRVMVNGIALSAKALICPAHD